MNDMNTDALLPLTPLYFQILLALVDDHRHGYGMLKEIESQTGGGIKPATGTLYLALQRMEELGLIAKSRRQPSTGDDKRRRYYTITPLGRRVALAETNRLLAMVGTALRKQIVGPASLAALASETS